MIHGGDIYRNKVNIDLSVSINPMGMPETVKNALVSSVEMAEHYPDMRCEALGRKLSQVMGVMPDHIVFGNGASELITAVVSACRPETAVLPVPSFGGYERALVNFGCKVRKVVLQEENGFLPDNELLRELEAGPDMLVIANPNNPTGRYVPRAFLEKILDVCEEKAITVLLDECFMELSTDPENNSCIRDTDRWSRLIILRSFTKTFAIPAVRLGYAVCGDARIMDQIRKQLPEWNVSLAAQMAGEAALDETGYVDESRGLILKEREFLADSLKEQGFKLITSDTNYLLFCAEDCPGLYDRLLERGILIRDCQSFSGLDGNWYRTAVRTHGENVAFIQAIENIRKTQ